MRLIFKLVRKLLMMVFMVFLMGGVLRYGQRYILKTSGMPEGPKFSSEEADLMTTVFSSAVKLFTGSASRKQLAGELSDKLYAGRDTQTMKDLGIELVSPGEPAGAPNGTTGAANTANLPPGISPAPGQPGASLRPQQRAAAPGESPAKPAAGANPLAALNPLAGENPLSAGNPVAGAVNTALLDRLWKQTKANGLELGLVPIVFLGMILVQRIRQRRSRGDDFMLPLVGLQTPAESEPYDMTHAVHSLGTEEFELLVALIYQRQGYRVSMPAGLSGGRGGDFTLMRKAERILVQCKKLEQEHRVPVERVRELRETMNILGLPKGMYVVSCGFTWDARNYAKANGITLINARILDELLSAAREKPDEDLLSVSEWVSKLMSKVQLTPPQCPACEAAMDLVNASTGSAWLCSQRPDCRGRRLARKYQKPGPAAARKTESPEDGVQSSEPAKPSEIVRPIEATKRSEATKPAASTEAAKPSGVRKPADGTSQPASAKPPSSSAIRLADKIEHEDPVKQAELNKLADMARRALQAKQAARARQEELAAATNRPNQPTQASTPAKQVRQPAPVTTGNQPTQTPQPRQAVPATPGNRPTQTPLPRQAVPATPGDRPTQTNPARRPVPATPGNLPNS
jgi:ssDNA-binding Zn-finger/Zn-ribbon topoisomerase 1